MLCLGIVVIVVFLTELLVPKNDRKGEILSILAIGLAALSIKTQQGIAIVEPADFLMVYLVQGKDNPVDIPLIPVIP